MQKITFIGNLTGEPETRTTQSGITVCSFNVAVNRRFTKPDNQKVTDFFRVNAWRGLGESCAKYLSKGKKVAVFGELQARIYEDKQGKTRMSLDVSADEVEFLSPKEEKSAQQYEQEYVDSGFKEISVDDLPF